MPRAIKTADKPQPAAQAAPTRLHPDTLLGSPHSSSIAAMPNYRPEDVAFRIPAATPTQAIPPIPHSHRLQIVRAQGGFILFAADQDFDQADADPCDAIAVASTADDLVRRIRDWTAAQPEPSVDANI